MIRRVWERMGEFLFPSRAVCLNCGDPSSLEEEWLCARCRARLKPGIHAVQSDEWPEDGVSRAWFALYYEEPIARLIRAFKYDGVYRLAPFFISCMRSLLATIRSEGFDCVVPVPLHEKRLRERGFNQAEVMAALISQETGIPLRDVLRRTRNTKRQARLPVTSRRENVHGAFTCACRLSGLRVLLVDDVFTTGSTANSCAKALRLAGARDAQALTLAGSRRYRRSKDRIYRKNAASNSSKP